MKTISKIIVSICIIAVAYSCSSSATPSIAQPSANAALTTKVATSDNGINAATLPQVVLSYIATNYPNITIVTSSKENNSNYEVNLSNGIQLIFNSTGTFLGIDSNGANGTDNYGDSVVSATSLSQVILSFISTNYPSKTISYVELANNGHYEIRLSDGLVIVFDATTGAFLGNGVDPDNVNNDNNTSTGTVTNPTSLPQAILNYVTTNYPTITIIQAKKEDNGNYEVTLSSGMELFFTSNGTFVNTGNGDDNGDGSGD